MPLPAPRQPEPNNDRLLLAALDHASKWVELRAAHRIQAVNSYLLAIAILATGYFTSYNANLHLAAATLAVVGLGGAFMFGMNQYRGLRRVRLSDEALGELERRLADKLGCPELQMTENVRRKADSGRFLTLPHMLIGYIGAGVVWVVAIIYALL